MNLLKEYKIREDVRFKQAKKESLRILCFISFETIWVFACAYWGVKVNPEDYIYILGLPMWFFWGLFGIAILFPLLAIILVVFTKDCSLNKQKINTLTKEALNE